MFADVSKGRARWEVGRPAVAVRPPSLNDSYTETVRWRTQEVRKVIRLTKSRTMSVHRMRRIPQQVSGVGRRSVLTSSVRHGQ
jgi:hypothetical protein